MIATHSFLILLNILHFIGQNVFGPELFLPGVIYFTKKLKAHYYPFIFAFISAVFLPCFYKCDLESFQMKFVCHQRESGLSVVYLLYICVC